MFESGAVICLGIIVWWARCSWKTRISILSHSLAVDLIVFTGLTIIHWGTFSGVMAATVGALMISLVLTIGRKCFGYNDKGKYMRGMWDISHLMVKKP
jgi:hypothetical protein